MTRHPLHKRRLYVYLDGWRTVIVTRVKSGKRTGLRYCRARNIEYRGLKPDGSNRWAIGSHRWTVDARRLHAPGAGVVYRGRIVPVAEFLARAA